MTRSNDASAAAVSPLRRAAALAATVVLLVIFALGSATLLVVPGRAAGPLLAQATINALIAAALTAAWSLSIGVGRRVERRHGAWLALAGTVGALLAGFAHGVVSAGAIVAMRAQGWPLGTVLATSAALGRGLAAVAIGGLVFAALRVAAGPPKEGQHSPGDRAPARSMWLWLGLCAGAGLVLDIAYTGRVFRWRGEGDVAAVLAVGDMVRPAWLALVGAIGAVATAVLARTWAADHGGRRDVAVFALGLCASAGAFLLAMSACAGALQAAGLSPWLLIPSVSLAWGVVTMLTFVAWRSGLAAWRRRRG